MNASSSRPRPACSCGQTSAVAAVVLIVALLFPATLGAQWVQTNGPYGGYISALAVSGSNLFAGTDGGVFLSTNNGGSWTAANNGLLGRISALAVSGSDLFAASGGVFHSSNNGLTWGPVNSGLTYASVTTLAVSGSNLFAGTVYSGTGAGTGTGGVFLSTNKGESWVLVNTGLTNTDIYSLVASGSNVFAGTANGGGVFLSTNNGGNWTPVNTGLTNTAIHALTVSGSNLFAGTDGGVFLSTNNGGSWTPVNTGLASPYVLRLAVIGTNLFAAAYGGVFLSTNNGGSWAPVNNGLTNTQVQAFAVSGTNLFAGTYGGGVFLSTNNGASWTQGKTGLSKASVIAFAVSGSDLFAGGYSGVDLSTNNGGNWTPVNTGMTNPIVQCFVVSGANTFAGTSGSGVYLSTNNGISWTAVNTGLTNLNIYSLAVSDANLFAGTFGNGVFISTNNGGSWTPISTGLTSTSIQSLAVSGTNLFAATYGGGVFLSTDHGGSWTPVNNGLTYNHVRSLAVSGSNLLEGESGVNLSTNNGASWTPVSTGLPKSLYWAFAVSGSCLFVGGGSGVFLSTNNGGSWAPVNTSLANTNVRSLTVSGSTLFAGTDGGAWRRPLSEMVPIMSLSQSSYSVSSAAGTVFAWVTNVGADTLSWTTIDHDPWLVSESVLKDTIAISYGVNTSASPRTGTVTVISNAWNSPMTLTITQAGATSGTLAVTVRDAEDWGLAGANASVRLYGSSGQLVGTQRTNASSVATFTNVPSGSGYYYTVEYLPSDPTAQFGTLYWGKKTGITVAGGQTRYDTFTRNMPYAPSITVFNSATNENVGSKTVPEGTPLRIELVAKNPTYTGAASQTVRARIVLDTNRTAPYEVDMSSTSQVMAVGSSSTIVFNYTPQRAGRYYEAGALIVPVNGVDTYTEGFSGYSQPFFTVIAPVTSPPWSAHNTGVSHTIIIPTATSPSVDGAAVKAGDYVGVFYDSSGTLACAGFERWTGTGDVGVSAAGDDPTTAAKDGLASGEVFKWKIYRASDGKVFDAQATYAPVGGIITNTNLFAVNGISRLSSLVGSSAVQILALRAGWSLVSSYIAPASAVLDDMFTGMATDMVILKNGQGRSYIPSVPVNSIGLWVSSEGYLLKMAAARSLTLHGVKMAPESTPLSLPSGWSIMAYLRESELAITSALGGVASDIVLVKDQNGKTYLPSLGVNSIGTMKPGQGYQVKMASAHVLNYPASTASPPAQILARAPLSQTQSVKDGTLPPWVSSNTGVSHSIILPLSATPTIDGAALSSGDYVGVFYDSSGTPSCAGFEAWTGVGTIVVTAYGDDPTTSARDGLVQGETFRWKLWLHSDGRIVDAHASYMPTGSLGGVVSDSGAYTANGISGLASLAGSLTSVRERALPKDIALRQHYPNPFNPSTVIRFELPRESYVSLRVYNPLGQEIRTLVDGARSAGVYEVRFDAAGLPSGMYIYRMKAGEFIQTKRLMLLR